MAKKKKMGNKEIAQLVTERIREMLKDGDIPWHKPFKEGKISPPRNLINRKLYKGCNFFLLSIMPYSSPYWLTYKQAKQLGGYVKEKEKSVPVAFWKWFEVEVDNPKTGETEMKEIPFLRYYRVWNLEQTENVRIPKPALEEMEKEKETLKEFNPIEEAQAVIDAYKEADSIEVNHGGNRAFYDKLNDKIQLPEPTDFDTPPDYYQTSYHEFIHSTGAESRLNRPELTDWDSFGGESYSKEELVGELGASMIAAHTGIQSEKNLKNSAAYIKGWLKRLDDDDMFFISAAGKAQKAVDYFLGK